MTIETTYTTVLLTGSAITTTTRAAFLCPWNHMYVLCALVTNKNNTTTTPVLLLLLLYRLKLGNRVRFQTPFIRHIPGLRLSVEISRNFEPISFVEKRVSRVLLKIRTHFIRRERGLQLSGGTYWRY